MAGKLKGLFEGVLEAGAGGKESKLEAHSRRVWLQNFAAVSATGAVLWACGSKKDSSTATPGCQALQLTADDTNAEIAGLNAALALENEGINIYTQAAGITAIWQASAHPLAPTFLLIAQQFLGHHQAHQTALQGAIKALGGTPVAQNPAATDMAHYPSTIGSLTGASGLYTILAAAAERELNASKAYYGLVQSLKAQNDTTLVASIAPDEAAHYGVLAAAAFAVAATASPAITTPLTPTNLVPAAFAGTPFAAVPGLSPYK